MKTPANNFPKRTHAFIPASKGESLKAGDPKDLIKRVWELFGRPQNEKQ